MMIVELRFITLKQKAEMRWEEVERERKTLKGQSEQERKTLKRQSGHKGGKLDMRKCKKVKIRAVENKR